MDFTETPRLKLSSILRRPASRTGTIFGANHQAIRLIASVDPEHFHFTFATVQEAMGLPLRHNAVLTLVIG